MKQVFALLALTALTISASAQTTKQHTTGYGAGIAEITWVNGQAALNLGGYGGVLVNHKFMFGASGNNIFFKQTVNGKKESFQLNYYGLYSEYRFKPANPVHMSVGLIGALGWQENDVLTAQKTRRKDGDYTFVLQPKLAVNTKITKWMQVQAYGSYRFTGNTKSTYYAKSNYNGAAAGVSLVFGGF